MELPKAEPFDPREALPSTVTFIGYHAAQRPDDVALIANDRTTTYNTFYLDIGRMVAALRGLGLQQGNAVAIEIPQRYLHLVMALSCEAIGAATFSYEESERTVVADLLATVDLVICMTGNEPQDARRLQLFDQAWLDTVLAHEPEQPVQVAPIGPTTPLRIVKSSGTTGSVKVMIHTGRVHQHWIQQFQFRTGLNRASRYLLAANFVVQAFHAHTVTCFRMGGTVVYNDRYDPAGLLASSNATHTTLFPYALIHVMDNLPDGYVKAGNLTIVTIGAPVSAELRRRVKQRLANDLMEAYGTNEVCALCTMDGEGNGVVLPGVPVETVDEAGNAVFGEPGSVRITSAGVVDGYLDNPEATRAMFRDGWFYPGDMAIMEDRSSLKLLGRADDLLNIRGVKFPLVALEAKLIAQLPVGDLCLASVNDAAGVSQVWAVVTLECNVQLPEIEAKAATLLPPAFGKINVIVVPEIPRTANGKLQREQVKLLLQQKLQPSAASP